MKRIAIYGKGGIGKSTTASNISAALCALGLRVMQIGCDPKADSTINLTGGTPVRSVLETLRIKRDALTLEDILVQGPSGCFCAESGGPRPGTGCAGRGIITAFETMERLKVCEAIRPDVVIYDVLGDVVCGGFAMPIRQGYADEVMVVSSGEKMSLYAARNIISAVREFHSRGYAGLGGIIGNLKVLENECEILRRFAQEEQADILAEIPRSSLIQQAEERSTTVVETFPDSELTRLYLTLARQIAEEAG